MSEEHWSSPNGCHEDCPACAVPTDEEYIARARGIHVDDDLEIDDDPALSKVTEEGVSIGAWVAAWVWVSDEDCEEVGHV